MKNRSFISSRIIALFIAFLGTIWAFLVHTDNLNYLQSTGRLFSDRMVQTADDASYLIPAYNYKHAGKWKDNTQGVSSYIQRPPGVGFLNYSFFALGKYWIFGLQKYFSLVLHFISLFLFGLMAMELLNKKTALFLQFIYAILPCFWGYLFYYLTESLTPSLLVILFYGFVKHKASTGVKWLFFQAIIIGALLLSRPQLAVFILPFFYYLWIYIREKHRRKPIIFFVILFLAFGGSIAWQIRSVTIAKHWVGLHPIYDVTNNTQYRPVHRSFGELFKIWEHNSEKFHNIMTGFWIEQPTQDKVVQSNGILPWPNHKILNQNENLLREIFYQYHLTSNEIIPYQQQKNPVPGETARETYLRFRVDSLTRELKKQMWKENYMITPIHSVQFMFSKSQLNLVIFQEKYRGKWWMEGLRYLCLGIIITSTFLTILQLLTPKNRIWFLLGVSTLLYFFYLFFIQKMNEERYVMPLLPLFLLSAFVRCYSFIKNRS